MEKLVPSDNVYTTTDSDCIDTPKRLRYSTRSSTKSENGTTTESVSSQNSGNGSATVSSTNSSSSERKRKNPQPKRRLQAFDEIKLQVNSTHLLIPRAPFNRLVREIMTSYNSEMRIQSLAIEALQESAEMYTAQLFADATFLMVHRRCKTIEPKDMRLAQYIRGPENFFGGNQEDEIN